MSNLEELYQAVLDGKLENAVFVTKQAMDEGVNSGTLVNDYMIRAMQEIGARFGAGTAYVPNLLLSARAMKGALELLKPNMSAGDAPRRGKVLICTVKGDLHDIGKNLVASMLEGCGFEVINIGIDVSAEKLIQAVKEHHPDLLAISALLTTTMDYMRVMIDALKEAGLRDEVKIMVGGAPVTASFAEEIGADGYSSNANEAVALANSLIG